MASSRRTSADEVAAHLRRLIFEGRLREGEHVRQENIAAEFGISRIPVREALVALDREGWLRIEPHKGTYVQGLDEKSIRDHYEVLGNIHGIAVRHAAAEGADDALQSISQLGGHLLDSRDADDFHKLTDDLWRLVFTAADSPRLTSMSRRMIALVPGNFFAEVPGAMEYQQRKLFPLLRHLRAGRAPAAERCCSDMVKGQAEFVVALLRTRQLLPPR
jgi:DNA-binding GntR family transcriptional regulator